MPTAAASRHKAKRHLLGARSYKNETSVTVSADSIESSDWVRPLGSPVRSSSCRLLLPDRPHRPGNVPSLVGDAKCRPVSKRAPVLRLPRSGAPPSPARRAILPPSAHVEAHSAKSDGRILTRSARRYEGPGGDHPNDIAQ